jgi:hypothetical protein
VRHRIACRRVIATHVTAINYAAETGSRAAHRKRAETNEESEDSNSKMTAPHFRLFVLSQEKCSTFTDRDLLTPVLVFRRNASRRDINPGIARKISAEEPFSDDF